MATKTKEKPKKPAARKPRPARPKQPPLAEDWGPPSFPDVDVAAEQYHESKLQRCEMSAEESERKGKLAEAMKGHGLTSYKTPHGIIVTLDVSETVKTSRDKGANGDGAS